MELQILFTHGDGGAFPEVHVQQFPMGIGIPRLNGDKQLAIRVDSKGEIDYTAILGVRQGQKVFSKPEEAEALDDEDIPPRPTGEEVQRVAEATQKELSKIVNVQIAAAKPSNPVAQRDPAQYIRYTPTNQNPAFNSGAKQRIIRMVQQPVDPLEPPKFRARKMPKGPAEAPVPIMHSPPRKVSPQEQQEWKIPPCLSNWKNPRGYTIPLDKRLAADGRTLQEVVISDKFAAVTEALYVAERIAREENEKRNALQRGLLAAEQQKKEDMMRQAANQARLARVVAGAQTSTEGSAAPMRRGDVDTKASGAATAPTTAIGGATAEEDEAAKARDIMREERKRQRERESRMEAAREARIAERSGEDGSKRSRQSRDRERDISERIVLGQARGPVSGESMYDQRLFNQAESAPAGFSSDEDYNVFTKPLFAGTSASQLYRPAREERERGFTKPVEFERDTAREDDREAPPKK